MGTTLHFKCDVGQPEPIAQSGFDGAFYLTSFIPNAFFDCNMRVQRWFVFLHLPQM